MAKLNWNGTCHIVNGEEFKDGMVDMHSHGLKECIGTEFQYVLDVGDKSYFAERQTLFSQVANLVVNKHLKLEDGLTFIVPKWTGCKFRFFKTKDLDGEDIFRIVECDMKGKFPNDDGCSSFYKTQYDNPLK